MGWAVCMVYPKCASKVGFRTLPDQVIFRFYELGS